MSTRKLTFNGTPFVIERQNFAKGGQGQVFRAYHAATKQPGIYKVLNRGDDTAKDGIKRLQYLVDNQIGHMLPQIAVPLVYKETRNELGYIAPYAPGVPLDQDKPRNFPARLEIAWAIICLWSRLEGLGIALGDVGHSNILITPEGRVDVIDTDGYAAQDPFVPKPTMVGQHPMLAPEIRKARNKKNPIPATLESDRFAWAVLLSCVLLYHHPTDGLVGTSPKKFDAAMMKGTWPERRRKFKKGETPIAALGPELPKLFDAAFSLNPLSRPSAKDWRIVMGQVLQNMVQHSCGQVYVTGPDKSCPWCGKRHSGLPPKAALLDRLVLRLRSLTSSKAAEFHLQRGQRLILGRGNIPGASGFVSAQHLELAIVGRDIRIENLGRNGSTLAIGGNPSRKLTKIATSLPGKALNGAVLTLADTRVAIEIS